MFSDARYPAFSIRIGRKAMTLGGDSSKAAIARSSDILCHGIRLDGVDPDGQDHDHAVACGVTM